MRARLTVAVAGVVLASCSGTPTASTEPVQDPPGLTPESVFDELVDAVGRGDHSAAADLTDPEQIPLLALAEGVEAGRVASFTDADRQAVAANFWAGFASQLESSLGVSIGDLRQGEVVRTEFESTGFSIVDLVLGSDASVRRMVVRDTPTGWVVDLIASFPSPLLGLIPDAAQAIRASGDETLLEELRGYEISVGYLLADPETDALFNQAATAALEAIIR